MRKIILLILLVFNILSAEAATIDTLKIFSQKMGRNINTLVIVPEVSSEKSVPTLYLLHGFAGDENAWMKIRDIRPIADQYGMLIVCPDGENSWYWDSPANSTSQYETFISSELPNYIDKHYPTIADRKSRAITGLSMGGHGAMWNALHHRDIFGAVGSTSGGLDVRPFPKNWEIALQLGTKEENIERWEKYTTINAIGDLKNRELTIIIDCGVKDVFIGVNRNFHNELINKGIDHEYIEREGAHNVKYWNKSIVYQSFFFHQFFSNPKDPE